MLFIWSGWGIVVIPVVVGTAVAVGAVGGLALRALGHPELTFLAISLGLFAAAAANWIVGRRLNGRAPRELIDPATYAADPENAWQRLKLRVKNRLQASNVFKAARPDPNARATLREVSVRLAWRCGFRAFG